MLPFLIIGGATTLYILWALTAYSFQVYVQENSLVYVNPATNHTAVAVFYVIATCGSLFFSEIKDMVIFGAANLTIFFDCIGSETIRIHLTVVRIRSGRERDHPRLLLEKHETQAIQIPVAIPTSRTACGVGHPLFGFINRKQDRKATLFREFSFSGKDEPLVLSPFGPQSPLHSGLLEKTKKHESSIPSFVLFWGYSLFVSS